MQSHEGMCVCDRERERRKVHFTGKMEVYARLVVVLTVVVFRVENFRGKRSEVAGQDRVRARRKRGGTVEVGAERACCEWTGCLCGREVASYSGWWNRVKEMEVETEIEDEAAKTGGDTVA